MSSNRYESRAIDVRPMALSSVGKAVAFILRACTAKEVIEALFWTLVRTLFALIHTQFRPLEPSNELKQVRDTRN